MTTVTTHPGLPRSAREQVPLLVNGDRLTRDEFERRYAGMPEVKKAELIEGVVYMPSPIRSEQHGSPHFDLVTWLGTYRATTPGLEGDDNTTLRLDLDNELQPDAILRIDEKLGGQCRVVRDGYLEGAPELIAEVTASTASYDLHDKKNAYRRNGVREYVVWRVLDGEIDWFALRKGQYERMLPDESGLVRSEVFPGLWLDPGALVRRDMAAVLKRVQEGLESPEHVEFVERLTQARKDAENAS